MSELTDAELCEAAARAMGGICKSIFPNSAEELTELRLPDITRWYWLGGSSTYTHDWNPLAVDEDGNPTERAAAQLWGVLMWLLRHSKTFDTDYWLNDEGGEEFEVYTMCAAEHARANTFARAVLLAAVAVANA